jgi:hypothetical protein
MNRPANKSSQNRGYLFAFWIVASLLVVTSLILMVSAELSGVNVGDVLLALGSGLLTGAIVTIVMAVIERRHQVDEARRTNEERRREQ